MKPKNTSHEFALYVDDLVVHSNDVVIPHKDVLHRMVHVLRLQEGDVFVVFNDQYVFRVVLTTASKKEATCHIQEKIQVIKPMPVITALVPVLKKEALEDAVYAAVELGVTRIVLTQTARNHHAVLTPSFMQRLKAIMHAAQEQAKQFFPVIIEGPVVLEEALAACKSSAVKIAALQGGGPLKEYFAKKPVSVAVIVGPESDFSEEEKELLSTYGFVGCSLGSTVLRAQQALTVLIGSVRSLTA